MIYLILNFKFHIKFYFFLFKILWNKKQKIITKYIKQNHIYEIKKKMRITQPKGS